MQDGATLYDSHMRVVGQLPPEAGASRDKAINWLAAETIGNGHSVLVFCAARWVRPTPESGLIPVVPSHAMPSLRREATQGLKCRIVGLQFATNPPLKPEYPVL